MLDLRTDAPALRMYGWVPNMFFMMQQKLDLCNLTNVNSTMLSTWAMATCYTVSATRGDVGIPVVGPFSFPRDQPSKFIEVRQIRGENAPDKRRDASPAALTNHIPEEMTDQQFPAARCARNNSTGQHIHMRHIISSSP